MTEFKVEDVDFDTVYQTGGMIPWIIGRPQQAVVDLADSGEISGDVLDVGCGAGDNAIFLASRGYRVTGLDGSAVVIERNRAKSSDVEFVVGDATKLEGLDGRFDTVLDSALYHCLSEEQRYAYMAALHRVTRPGARLHLICFDDRLPAPFRVTEASLRETVGTKFRITSLRSGVYDSSMRPGDYARAVADLAPGGDVPVEAPAGLRVGADGRVQFPVWQVGASRLD
jgi:SAM-dependent methyltransferase